ncbi:MAG TPA: 3-hydroxyacyl-CoA dehydrogenase NAD-binding domain-containing protein [Gammaproteobacteria bacterium]|jgi:3-hydroxyacyl-CoA dehydrogenase/enoyl-CoA hydratase/3-hydroxybutyryl-CoA epimerase
MSGDLKHWRIETDADGLAWCTLDVAGESANVLSSGVLEELGRVIDRLEKDRPRGAVIQSGKESGFIAGADVREFAGVRDSAQAEEFIRSVHAGFGRLERLPFPTLALINGYCLGGGLELALACTYRVATEGQGTRLGFPEVMVGIFPGFGGSMRSIRCMGAPQALELMLSGRNLDARRAARAGLIDRAVPERQMHTAARTLLLRGAPPKRASFPVRLLRFGPLRKLLGHFLRRAVRGKANPEHYPAPYALIEHWESSGGSDRDLLESEARTVSKLITTPTSRNLVRVFLLQERLKSLGRADGAAPQRVHVVGAGVMGGDIAAWCVAQGLSVTLQDREPRFLAPALKRAHALFRRRLRESRLVQAALDRLVPDLNGGGAASADVIIEAIVEKREAKAELFKSLEGRARGDAILATNTSSIALEELGTALGRPERLVGIHFFNPVDRMQLVEIVHGPATGADWIQRAAAFCRKIGRLPLPVKSSPGFLVNRILTPYLMETTLLLEEGVPAEAIDRAATDFGMPMGPVELADTVGLDICLSVARNMAQKIDIQIPKRLEELVAAGQLGRKSGRGFYAYRNGRPQKNASAARAPEDVTDRLVLRILNECAACLREGIVEDADLLDGGMIFGTGFAPFRGGPMRYAQDRGHGAVVERLEDLEKRCGPRFAPDAWWRTRPAEPPV